jgi:hypothetical protein
MPNPIVTLNWMKCGGIPDGFRDSTSITWFKTAAFAGRHMERSATLHGPGLATVNFSVVKNTRVGERLNVQFRAEFFNLLDRTNFNLPDNFVGSPMFGQITSAQDAVGAELPVLE